MLWKQIEKLIFFKTILIKGGTISECTLCGKKVYKLFLTKVEGSEIEVCESCQKFGKVIKEIRPKIEQKPKIILEKPVETEELLRANYGRLIMEARQKLGLQRKDFALKIKEKESLIKRVESQQMRPDDKLRKKIEYFLKIKLTEVYEEKKLDQKPIKPTLTIGDIVEVD